MVSPVAERMAVAVAPRASGGGNGKRRSHAPARAELFARLLGRQLGRLLRLVDTEVRGWVTRPDGFALPAGRPSLPEPPPGPRVRCETLFSYARMDPRVDVIGRGVARARRLGVFLRDGRPLPVDGFRLRDLAQWAAFPTPLLADNIGAISSYCNCDCEFCFERGTRGAGVALGKVQLGMQEVETRIRYYSRERGTGILPAARFSLEPFANPRCLEILERIRQASPEECLDMTTNGSMLTEPVVARLAKLRPMAMVVSINAGKPEQRLRSMRDRLPEGAATAFRSFELLRQHGIPFVGSYVPWPTKPLSDLEDTVRLLDRCDALAVRVCLPTWTAHSHEQPPFDTDTYWPEILAVVEQLRREVATPIQVVPGAYQLRTMRPVLRGACKGSPAAAAGIRAGDVALAVAGEPVYSRPGLMGALAKRWRDPEIRSTTLTLQRELAVFDVTLEHQRDPEKLGYPYRELVRMGPEHPGAASLGLSVPDGFELSSIAKLGRICEEFAGRRLLLLVSPLGAGPFSEALAMLGDAAGFPGPAQAFAEVVWPCEWGGNVIVGDLWTVRDIVVTAQAWIEREGVRPDVIVVPSTFMSSGGRDLKGRCWVTIERALGIEVRLLPCDRIGT